LGLSIDPSLSDSQPNTGEAPVPVYTSEALTSPFNILLNHVSDGWAVLKRAWEAEGPCFISCTFFKELRETPRRPLEDTYHVVIGESVEGTEVLNNIYSTHPVVGVVE
jgi:hypothetical protein